MLCGRLVSELASFDEAEAAVSALEGKLHFYKEDEDEPTLLGDKPTLAELVGAVENTRNSVHWAIGEVLGLLREMRDDFDKQITRLTSHRHDSSKNYTGRPEL